MAGPHCERLNGMASRIDTPPPPPPINTASCDAPVSLSVRVLPEVSVSIV